MKKNRLLKMTFGLIGLVLLTVSGIFGVRSKSVHADDNTLMQNSPWGINDGMVQMFNSSGTGWGSQQGSNTYNPLLFKSGTGSSPAYLWSTDKYSIDLTKSRTMSYWIQLGTYNGNNSDTANDGLAFVLNGGSSDKNGSGLSNDAGIGGTSLGVWGDSTSYKPSDTGLKNSLAVEFDTYMNRDNYDSYAGDAINYDIGAAYPGESETYQYTGAGSHPQANLHLQGVIPAVNNATITGRWIHVTFDYQAPATGSAYGKLYYYFDDEDPSTGEDTTTTDNTQYVNVDQNKLGGSTARIGFVSSNKSSNANMVIVDTDSALINADVTGKLIDTNPADGSGKKEVTNGGFVYGNDPLSYQYTVANKNSANAPNGLRSATIRTKLPKELTFADDATTIGEVTYSNNSHPTETIPRSALNTSTNTLEYKLASTLQAGETATISIDGKAASVMSNTTVSGSNWRAFNGGLDESGSNPTYTIRPGIITTTNGTINNFSEVGDLAIGGGAHVFTGDSLGYTFNLDYDAKNSVINWNGPIKATIKMPSVLAYKDLSNATTYFEVKTTDDSGNVIFKHSYSAAEIEAGEVAVTDANGLTRNPIHNHITITVTGEVNEQASGTIPAATATFETDQHSDIAKTPSFDITNVTSNPSAIQIATNTQTIDADQVGDAYEGENYVNITGSWNDTNTAISNNNQIAMFATVEGKDSAGKSVMLKKHIQLTAGNNKQFNIAFTKPKITAQAYDGTTQPAQEGQLMDDSSDQMLHLGVNTIYLHAVDANGNSSNPIPVTINVGLFKFMNATQSLDFPSTKLQGKSQDINSDGNMVLTMNNSRQETGWAVTAKEAGNISSGKTQPVRLMYGDKSLATATTIADSNSGLTTSADGTITLINSNKDLHVNVNGGAVSGTYKTTVDWTLVNSVQP